tara:strand:- start:532 stop:2850 length:2319 start_codon:yes stop_codon:yes gene_type:complete
MSLDLNYLFENKTILKENWLFQLFYDDESATDFFGVSYYDTVVDSVDYKGCVLNKATIRESINLENSKAKTSNVNLTLSNFIYGGDGEQFSRRLFNSTNKYINRKVKIYIQPDDTDDIAMCILIYTGRLEQVSHTSDKINLSIVAKRPWDKISIPSEKTTANGVYVPISYGNYTENPASTFASPQFETAMTSKAYRPVPFNKMNDKSALYVDGISTTSSGELAVYEKGLDIFVPLENAVANNGSKVDGAYHDKSDLLQIRAFQQRADSVTSVSSSNVTVTNEGYSINGDDSNYASYSVSFIQSDNSGNRTVDLGLGTVSGKSDKHFITLRDADRDVVLLSEALDSTETGVDISDDEDIRVNDVIKIDNEEMAVTNVSSNTLTVRRGFGSKKDTHANSEIVYYDQTINAVAIKYEVIFTTNIGNNTVSIRAKTDGDNLSSIFTSNQSATTLIRNITNGTDSIRLQVHFNSSEVDDSNPATLEAEVRIYDVYLLTQRISEVPEDILYVANDGFTDNGWNSNNRITEIHEAHRDLLTRFTSYSGTPDNWSSGTNLNSAKDWQIRYWVLESTPLIDVLDKLAFEGGFIGRFNGQGNYQYIYIPDSPSSNIALDKDDINDIKVSLTPVSSLITKMDIEYEKHPAVDRYISNATSVSDSDADLLSIYNIASDENEKRVELDAYVSPAINTSRGSSTNKNDCFYRYYDHILGQTRIILDFTIINPNYLGLDVGDIFTYSDSDFYPFAGSTGWSDYKFMITDVNRSLGKLKITAREIHNG